MKIISTVLLALLLGPQKLPDALQVSQLENSGTRITSVVVVRGQTPVITNTPQLPAIQLEQQPQAPGLGSTFSVRFVDDADLRAVLTALAQYHSLNLVMPPDITGSVNIELENVTLTQALDAILGPRNLQFRIEGNMLFVDRPQMETRTFTFDYITTERNATRSVNASSSAGGAQFIGAGTLGAGTTDALVPGSLGTIGGGGSTTSVSGRESTNLLIELEDQLSLLRSENGRVVVNRMAGLIFATDFPRNLDMIGTYLDLVESAVHRQVIIEAKVIEVRLDENSQTGIDWTAILGNTVRLEQDLGVQGAFQIGVTHTDFTALISLLRTQGTVNVLSSPTIATLNNQPAIIRVGTQDVFFTTATQVDPRTGIIVQTAEIPQAINEGVVLDVTPQISDDGIITMNIHPAITERTGQVTSPAGSTVPIVDVRETDTVVRVAEGAVVLIGGLISDRVIENVSKVPLLGDLPVLGSLFRRETMESRKTDLVILLTPRILNVRTAADYTRSRLDAQEQQRTAPRN